MEGYPGPPGEPAIRAPQTISQGADSHQEGAVAGSQGRAEALAVPVVLFAATKAWVSIHGLCPSFHLRVRGAG